MKVKLTIIIILSLLLICALAYSYYYLSSSHGTIIDQNKSVDEDKLQDNNQLMLEKALSNLQPYCDLLEANANNSAYPTCYYRTLNSSYYRLVERFNESSSSGLYTIETFDQKSVLYVNLNLIYGWNTRTGNAPGNFTFDSQGNLIEKNVAIKGYVGQNLSRKDIIGYFN